jgi:hypothetical protein
MNSLTEMLDALELGLMELRRERNKLRQTLDGINGAATDNAPKPTPAKTPSAKARPALGRTLTQIRKSSGPGG